MRRPGVRSRPVPPINIPPPPARPKKKTVLSFRTTWGLKGRLKALARRTGYKYTGTLEEELLNQALNEVEGNLEKQEALRTAPKDEEDDGLEGD